MTTPDRSHKPTRRAAALLSLAAVAALAPSRPAHALFGIGGGGPSGIVFDPTNFAQHVAILGKHVEQLGHLQAQVQRMDQMLQHWDFSRLGETVGQMQRIGQTLDGIAGTFGDLHDRFPADWGDAPQSRDPDATIAVRQRQWRDEQRTRDGQVVELHAQVAESIAQTRDRVGEYVERSNAAPGPLAAQQATNELLAVQIQQLQEMQALEVAAVRADLERLAADASEGDYNAGLRRAMHESHLRSIQQLNDEDLGPGDDAD